MPIYYQINLQRSLCGSEVYTKFICEALAVLDRDTVIFVHPEAQFWKTFDLPRTEIVPVFHWKDMLARIEATPNAVVWNHAPMPEEAKAYLWGKQNLTFCLFCHNPISDIKKAQELKRYNHIFAVSNYVLRTLKDAGIEHAYPYPLYGVADLKRADFIDERIERHSVYDWDLRKIRDRFLSCIEPLWSKVRRREFYKKRQGITLGIVSRITTIKQFPRLFSCLVSILKSHPDVYIEIFGSGGYASLRDLKRALHPIRSRIRFWGHQANVKAVYGHIDYLLTGLPEREALGLNVLEAQACGVPVIAIDAPPFTETILPNVTGFLYIDPRIDGGKNFDVLLGRLVKQKYVIDSSAAKNHLSQFSLESFSERLSKVLIELESAA